MNRDFKITCFRTYMDKYCFVYMICLTCGTEIGRTIANVTLNGLIENKVGDVVTGSCYVCGDRNRRLNKQDYELLDAMRFVNACLKDAEE